MYYHQFCLPDATDSTASVPPNTGLLSWTRQERHRRKGFDNQFGLRQGDAQIITYLAEVVKLQQITVHAKSIGREIGTRSMKTSLDACVRLNNESGPLQDST